TGEQSAVSQRNHLHLVTTNDQRQQARGGGESQRKRDEPRGKGTDGTCRWENPNASHTNLAAEEERDQGQGEHAVLETQRKR
ncbi:hypothetical protein GQ42DRAFT_163625, partial [Ramicandelaber brevisporus]